MVRACRRTSRNGPGTATLGPVVTFGEWLSYNPPPKGGRPPFSLAVPSGEAVSPGKAVKGSGREAFRAQHPGHAEVPRGLVESPAKASGGWRKRPTASRRS